MKKYTMQDFFSGLCLIKVANNKEHKELMRECQKAEKTWMSGIPITEGDKRSCGGLFVFEDHGSGLKLCVGENTRIPNIAFADVLRNGTKYQITIDCDGDTTTARMIVNGKEVKTGKSTRNPDDKFNWKMGAQLAFDRLWGEKHKAKVKEVKRHAKIGEYVKVVAAEHSHNENYKTNDIRRVKRYFTFEEGWVYLEGAENCACSPKEYVVLEGYKPNK